MADSLGEVFFEVGADAGDFANDLQREVKAALNDTERQFDRGWDEIVRDTERAGDRIGDVLEDGIEDGVRGSLQDLERLERGGDELTRELSQDGEQIERQLEGSFDSIRRRANRDLDRIGEGAGRLTSKFRMMGPMIGGAIAAVGIAAFARGASKAVGAAADLGESINAIQVVLGDGADSFLEFGETAASSLGITQQALNQAIVPIAAIFKNAGIEGEGLSDNLQTLATRATDVGSVFNEDTNVVLEAFGSALRGEAEPARRFGVQLDANALSAKAVADGIAEVGEELTPAQKTQAAYALILEQTDVAAGDMIATMESLPNVMKRTAAVASETGADFGEGLLGPVRRGAIELLEGLEDLRPAIQNAGRDMGVSLGPAISDAVEGLLRAGEVAIPILVEASSTLSSAFQLIGDASQIMIDALEAVGAASADAEDRWVDATSAFIEGNTEAVASVKDGVSAFNDQALSAEGLALAMRSLTDPGTMQNLENIVGFFQLDVELDDATGAVVALDEAMAAMVGSGDQELAKQRFDELAEAAKAEGLEVEDVTALLPQYTAATDLAGAQSAVTASEMEQLADRAEEGERSVDKLTAALDSLVGINITAEQAVIRLEGDLAELTEGAIEAAGGIDITTEAGRQNRSAFLDVADSILTSVDAQKEAGASSTELRAELERQVGRLREQAEAAGLSASEVDELVESIGLVPSQVFSSIDIDTDAAIAEIERYLGYQSRVDRNLGIVVNVSGSGGGGHTQRARGGPIGPDDTYLVGEEGPELAVFGRHGTVIPNDQLRDLFGGPAPVAAGPVDQSVTNDIDIHLSTRDDPSSISRATALGVRSVLG